MFRSVGTLVRMSGLLPAARSALRSGPLRRLQERGRKLARTLLRIGYAYVATIVILAALQLLFGWHL